MAWKTVKAKIVGVSDLIMHNGQLSDPLNYYSIEMRKITDSKRGANKKTEADHVRLAQLEFMGGLWLDDKGEPAIPSDAIEAMLQKAGASVQRVGGKRNFATGIRVLSDFFPLKYSGPRQPEKLWGEGFIGDKKSPFVFRKAVKNMNARVQRTRPRFADWSIDLEFQFDDETVQKSQIKDALDKAGDVVGIGDWRPSSPTPGKFGRFRVESMKID